MPFVANKVTTNTWHYEGKACIFGDALHGTHGLAGSGTNICLINAMRFFETIDS